MDFERICYGCFGEKEPKEVCPNCGYDENEPRADYVLPPGTVLNGKYIAGKVTGESNSEITYAGFVLKTKQKVSIREYLPSAFAVRADDHYLVEPDEKAKDRFAEGVEQFLAGGTNGFRENNTAYLIMGEIKEQAVPPAEPLQTQQPEQAPKSEGKMSIKDQVEASIVKKAEEEAGYRTADAAPSYPTSSSGGFQGLVQTVWNNFGLRIAVLSVGSFLVAFLFFLLILSPFRKPSAKNNMTHSDYNVDLPDTDAATDDTTDVTDAADVTEPAASEPALPADFREREISGLNAALSMPDIYEADEDGFFFSNKEADCYIRTAFCFIYQNQVPIYHLADVKAAKEYIIANHVDKNAEGKGYEILKESDIKVDGRDAYELRFFVTSQKGTEMAVIMTAVEGDNDFGCYLLMGYYENGNAACEKEVENILSSFRCLGPVNTGCKVYSDSSAGLKFIYSEADALGGIRAQEATLGQEKVQGAIVSPFSDKEDVYFLVEKADAVANDAAGAIDYIYNLWSEKGLPADNAQSYTFGDITWTLRSVGSGENSMFFAAADINGHPYLIQGSTLGASFNDIALQLQYVMITLRPF